MELICPTIIYIEYVEGLKLKVDDEMFLAQIYSSI